MRLIPIFPSLRQVDNLEPCACRLGNVLVTSGPTCQQLQMMQRSSSVMLCRVFQQMLMLGLGQLTMKQRQWQRCR